MEQRTIAKLDELEQILTELADTLPDSSEEHRQNKVIQRAVERLIQIAIECVIDICAMLVKTLRLGLPSSEEDYFDKLRGVVFEDELTDRLILMRRFRNRVVHRYGDIDQRQVFEIVHASFSDFQLFMQATREFLKNR